MLRRLIWRFWYERLATQFTADGWTFMNYGSDGNGRPELVLEAKDETNRFYIQLYHLVASAVELEAKEVLEVGSGRGGGASFLARYHRPARVVGVDFSPQAVALCQRHHAAVERLSFSLGDAENLPFGDSSFDAIVNVESSHCYGQIDRFFAECLRVLRPGGYFLYADFRPAADMIKLHEVLVMQTGWTRVAHEDITGSVVDAMQADDARKRRMIGKAIPVRFQHVFGEFAGLVGGNIYEGFRKQRMVYHRFVFQKHSTNG